MTPQFDPTRLGKIRDTLARPDSFLESGGLKKLMALGQEVGTILKRHASEGGPPPREVTEIAFAIQNIAETDMNGSLTRGCLDFWFTLGPFGWTLALNHLNKRIISFTIMEPILGRLTEPQHLLLLHEFSRTPYVGEPGLADFCVRLVTTPREWDASAIIKVLCEVESAGQTVGIYLKEVVMQSGAFKRFEGTLRKPPKAKSLDRMVRALAALGEPLSGDALAQGTRIVDESNLPFLLQAAERCGCLGEIIPLCKETGKLLNHSDSSLRLLAVKTLNALSAPQIDKPYLFLLKKYPQEKAALFRATLDLGGVSFNKLLEQLPTPDKNECLCRLFSVLSKGAPDFTAVVLKGLLTKYQGRVGPEDAAFAKATEFVKQHESKRYFQPKARSVKEGTAPKADGFQERKKAFLSSFSSGKPGKDAIAKALQSPFNVDDLVVKGLAIADVKAEKKSFRRANFSCAKLSKARFVGCSFTDVDFSGCLLEDVRFTGCKFDRVSFKNAFLGKTMFKKGSLKSADFTGAIIDTCAFSEVAGVKTGFPYAVCGVTRFDGCYFQEGNFLGVSLEKCRLQGVRFSVADFSHASFYGCSLRGLEFSGCNFTDVSFETTSAISSSFSSGTFRMSRFSGVEFDDPAFQKVELDAEMEKVVAVAGALGKSPVEEWVRHGFGLKLAGDVVKKWFLTREIRQREQLFLANNNRRFDMAMNTLKSPKSDFYILLPYLLQSRVFEKTVGLKEEFPLCVVEGYSPGYSIFELGKRNFQNFEFEPTPEKAVRVEAVYTIGSVGTIAMTAASDIDYWVCVHPEDSDPKVLAALSRKLVEVTKWADEVYGLEITFFVMNMDHVRDNSFGFSDKESSGSAQALLLKEEYYRTAVKVCGKNLAWWLVPPIVDSPTYRWYLDHIKTCPAGVGKRVVDMGRMAEIPPGEFFGASLWQIVKAFKSPFKSIMKFGLLEKYTNKQEGRQFLLCERIKDNILKRRSNLFAIDPYAVMFKEVRNYQMATGDKTAATLMDLAFLLKVQEERVRAGQVDGYSIQKERLLDEFFGGREKREESGAIIRSTDFSQILELGNHVNIFMLSTYGKVQKSLAAQDTQVQIDPVDITKLGRKIFSAFAKRKHKIQRIPFVNPMKKGFREVMLCAERSPGKPPIWVLKGLAPDAASKKDNYMEIQRGRNVTSMLIWVVVNKLFHPQSHVEADMNTSPISSQDVAMLLPALYEFFPPKTVFEVDLDETLQPERLVKAFFILNMLTSREWNKIEETSIVYVTNWGELFCVTMPVKGDLLRATPIHFLKNNLTVETPESCKLGYFIPTRSKCPRPII